MFDNKTRHIGRRHVFHDLLEIHDTSDTFDKCMPGIHHIELEHPPTIDDNANIRLPKHHDRVLLLLKVEESHCRVLLVDVVVRQLASQRFGPRWPWCDVEEASFRVGVLDLT